MAFNTFSDHLYCPPYLDQRLGSVLHQPLSSRSGSQYPSRSRRYQPPYYRKHTRHSTRAVHAIYYLGHQDLSPDLYLRHDVRHPLSSPLPCNYASLLNSPKVSRCQTRNSPSKSPHGTPASPSYSSRYATFLFFVGRSQDIGPCQPRMPNAPLIRPT